MNTLEERVRRLEERNQRVELNKRWETSKTCRLVIALGTYGLLGAYMMWLGVEQPWLSALVPTLGFLLSTLGLGLVRRFWMRSLK